VRRQKVQTRRQAVFKSSPILCRTPSPAAAAWPAPGGNEAEL
jgi:hypothetical protein